MWVKGNIYLPLVWMQTGAATREICVVLFQKAENISTTFSSYTTLGHTHSGLYMLL